MSKKSSRSNGKTTMALATRDEPDATLDQMGHIAEAICEHIAVAAGAMRKLDSVLQEEDADLPPSEDFLRTHGDEVLAALQEAISLAHQRARLIADLKTQHCASEAEARTARLLGHSTPSKEEHPHD